MVFCLLLFCCCFIIFHWYSFLGIKYTETDTTLSILLLFSGIWSRFLTVKYVWRFPFAASNCSFGMRTAGSYESCRLLHLQYELHSTSDYLHQFTGQSTVLHAANSNHSVLLGYHTSNRDIEEYLLLAKWYLDPMAILKKISLFSYKTWLGNFTSLHPIVLHDTSRAE